MPVFSIGPSWPFTIGLFIFTLLCLAYFGIMIYSVWKRHPQWCYPQFLLLTTNLYYLARGVLSDPGIPKHTHQVYNQRSQNESLIDSRVKEAEKNRRYRPKFEIREQEDGTQKQVKYCVKCDIDLAPKMEHCNDCDVCIENWDHHCVFYSKCIGKGNQTAFNRSIGLLIANFIYLLIIVISEIMSQVNQRKYRG